jgi:hypothetical protein
MLADFIYSQRVYLAEFTTQCSNLSVIATSFGEGSIADHQ